MKFGITLRPDQRLPATRAVDLAKRAEANGFGYGWMFDSHVLWQDPYPLLTLIGAGTTAMRLGTCVTNPATRDITVTASALATLNEITGGRMDLGIGRGDSARRVMGKKPTTVAYMEECCRIIRSLTAGEKITLDGTEIQMPWARHGPVPVWVAGYGPIALAAAGRVADGVILQLADPDIIRWCIGFVRAAAAEAGRDPDAIEVMAAAPAFVERRRRREPATGALVPGPRQQSRRRPHQQVPEGRAARGPLALRREARGLRLPPPRRGRQRQRGFRLGPDHR